MFEMLERLLGRLRNVWDGMNLNQKVVSGGVLAASLIAALYISTLSDKMLNYTVLFAQLDAQSASQITASLEQDNIPYRLTQGGTAIEVPVSEADRLKIDFIAEGLPESGIVGYEILDTTNFGMSDFLQKVNYKRALEGELSRTLRAIDEIKNAHVLLVIPEPSLFAETANPPTASVVLTLKSNRTLPKSKVEAIANLVASAAVEGLDPRDVTILDNRGVQLSEPVKDELAMESGTIMELKFSYEQRLADRVKSMIDGAFGAGIALIVVNADLDFDRIERMTTAYDQSASAIASENRREVTNPAADGGGEEETTTNYETGNIVETLIRTPGSNVRRLSVSVMIDGRETQSVDEDGETVVEKVPWSAAELASIRAISETAVGYDVDRGDRIEVVHMDFDAREYEAAGGGLTIGAAITEIIGAVATGVAIIVALGILYFIVKNIVNTLDPEKIKMKADKQFRKEILSSEVEEEEIVPSERSEIIRKIITRAAAEPEMTAKTIKSIYRED
jgi:flagellar M-ring protein FliF